MMIWSLGARPILAVGMMLAGLAVMQPIGELFPTDLSFRDRQPDAAMAVKSADFVTSGAGKNVGHIPRSADGMFYVDAAANGKPVRFLIDTGASVTVLTRSDAVRLGITEASLRRNNNLKTAGGKALAGEATLGNVVIADHQIENLRVMVIDSDLGVSLLGQDALSTFSRITLEQDRMTIA